MDRPNAIKRLIEFIGEIIRSDIRAFADVPVSSRIGIGSRLVAKTDQSGLVVNLGD
jgi:hypothetical protein